VCQGREERDQRARTGKQRVIKRAKKSPINSTRVKNCDRIQEYFKNQIKILNLKKCILKNNILLEKL